MNRLAGKRALITGGTTGIGLETARQFLKEGARVAITGLNSKTLDEARKDLGGYVLAISSNAGDVSAQRTLAKAVQEAFGGLDVLVINAGVGEFRPLDQWDEAAFDRSFAINVKGPFFLAQALLPIFANPASIVLNASINAHLGMPNSSVYAATKAAILSLARTLSGELVSRGIRVNAVSPGPITTPFHHKLAPTDAERKAMSDYITSQIPAGRFGNATEVAQAMVFFASDEAAFTVGSELVIDGGMSTL
jgi:NAD(P)-dependent dehydrogenase (short-subunit alcohol dehydrogenase family)